MSEQRPKLSHDEVKPRPGEAPKRPAGAELDDGDLDSVAGGHESLQKSAAESESKSAL